MAYLSLILGFVMVWFATYFSEKRCTERLDRIAAVLLSYFLLYGGAAIMIVSAFSIVSGYLNSDDILL